MRDEGARTGRMGTRRPKIRMSTWTRLHNSCKPSYLVGAEAHFIEIHVLPLLGWIPCFKQTKKPTKNEDGVFQCCSFCTFHKLPLFKKKMFGQVL